MKQQLVILIATHKEFEFYFKESEYQPIFLGNKGKPSPMYLSDKTGENISSLNEYYSELTGLYWAWKNISYKYLGLVHYRRYFSSNRKGFFSKNNFHPMSAAEMIEILSKYDIILPRKRYYIIETLWSHYSNTFQEKHLKVTREILNRDAHGYLSAFDKVMKRRWGYMFNMFVMNEYLLDQYLTWLFPILEEIHLTVDSSQYSSFEKRYIGRISELLLNVWIEKHKLKKFERSVIYLDKDLSWKRISSFLKAKFFKIKYSGSF